MLVKSRCCAWVCALSLTMFTRREAMLFEHCKYRRMRTLPRQCILVQVREKRELGGLRVERRMDLHLLPLFLLLLLFSSSYFSHIIVRSGCEKQQHRSICFPERSDARKQCYTWHCFVYPVTFFNAHVAKKELILAEIKCIKSSIQIFNFVARENRNVKQRSSVLNCENETLKSVSVRSREIKRKVMRQARVGSR